MKQHLDENQLRSLRQLYTSTQYAKEVAIEDMVAHWGAGAVARLNLENYSNMSLRSLIKVAELIGMEEADAMLSKIALRRLQTNRPSRGSVRGITTRDWQDLAAALTSADAKTKVHKIPVLTDDEQNLFGITQPLSIFEERIQAPSFSYGRRRLRENSRLQTGDSARESDLSRNNTQAAKRLRVGQKYSCLCGRIGFLTFNIPTATPRR